MITDDQGKLQTSYDYDAFGNALNTAQPNSTINHRYVGEYLDEDSGFYHLRARDYDPKIGRFISRDSFEGVKNNPITLNPYLYANADPVNGVDPSGHMVLLEINISLSTRSWAHINTLLNLYNKIDKALVIYQSAIALKNASNYFSLQIFQELLKGAKKDKGFINAITNYDLAMANLGSNIPNIIAGITNGEVKAKVIEFIKGSKNNLLIFGPTPTREVPWISSSRISIGEITLAKSRRKIQLETGRASQQGGRLIGLGHTFGNRPNFGQWFRMDWHPIHGNEDFVSGDYHYHWNINKK